MMLILLIATIVMLVMDYRRFYVYVLAIAGMFLECIYTYAPVYEIELPKFVGLLASLITVAVLFVAIFSRRKHHND